VSPHLRSTLEWRHADISPTAGICKRSLDRMYGTIEASPERYKFPQSTIRPLDGHITLVATGYLTMSA
jgi:hypothetical protein